MDNQTKEREREAKEALDIVLQAESALRIAKQRKDEAERELQTAKCSLSDAEKALKNAKDALAEELEIE